jgi:DNA-binding MarR family transcriptional regulator
MSEVAAHLQVSRSNVTGIVTRLERKGLVERQPDPRDRRAVVLALTPLAQRINDALREARETVLTAAVAELSSEERAVLHKALSAMHATMFQQNSPEFLRHPE